MKKAIITGATGLIGSHLVLELLNSAEYELTAIVRSESSKTKLGEIISRRGRSLSELHFVMVDTADYEQLRSAIEGYDVVFHCAAIVSFEGGNAERIVSNNVELTSYVVDSCLASSTEPLLVHISSIAALGTAAYPQLTTENTPFTNIATASPYSRSKFLSENEVWRGVKLGLKAVIVSPSVVLGIGATGSEGLQPLFKMAASGISIYTDGIVGYVDVVDVARAIRLLAGEPKSWGRRYILSGYNLTFKEFLSDINVAFGHKRPKIRIGKWVLNAGVKIISRISKNSPLTDDVTGFLTTKTAYDGTSVEKTVPFAYTPIGETLDRLAREYAAQAAGG